MVRPTKWKFLGTYEACHQRQTSK